MEIFLTLIAGLGLGSFLGSYIQLNWNKKKFEYEVKLKLYANFINNYQQLVSDTGNEELRQKTVASLKQLELISCEKIIEESQKFYGGGGVEVRDNLIKLMRGDLKSTLNLKEWF
ncbi:TPA: hypothetical protein NGI80_000800 [Legionella pneumophila]|nr:hypothetical protein [Legionella pneumophila]HCD9729729.1 hypothetical protein [Legionella pneumophila]